MEIIIGFTGHNGLKFLFVLDHQFFSAWLLAKIGSTFFYRHCFFFNFKPPPILFGASFYQEPTSIIAQRCWFYIVPSHGGEKG